MFLRHATASQVILLGRFVDSTDGFTPETALTINNSDIKLWKEGATTLVSKNSGGATHIASGMYYTTLDATDTNTPGKLEVLVYISGALDVRRQYTVQPAPIFDALTSGNAYLIVDVLQSGTVGAKIMALQNNFIVVS